MLASITPLGERGRQSTWAVTVAAFALGASAAGAAAGALAGTLGALVLSAASAGRAQLAVLAAGLTVAAALDARATAVPRRRAAAVPGPRRQVNERWLDEYRGWVYGLGFGAQLGLGVTTVVTSAATYAALLAALLSRAPGAGALIVGCFGAIRGLTPLAGARVRTPGQLLAMHRTLAVWERPARLLTLAVLGSTAVVATSVAWLG